MTLTLSSADPFSTLSSGEEASEVPKKAKNKRHQPHLFCKGQTLRLYPTADQAQLLRQWIGTTRYVWNQALEKQNAQYLLDQSHLSQSELSRELTGLRKQDGMEWLGAVPRTALTCALNHLSDAWTGFFEGKQDKRLDEPGKPVFRCRNGHSEGVSFQVDPRHSCPLDLENQTLRLPGLGWVNVVISEPLVGEISQITVRQKGHRWLVSLTLINVSKEALQRSSIRRNILNKQDFPDNPTDLALNPNREGLAALDASVVSGAVATTDGKITFSVFHENVLRSDEKKHQKRVRYQRAYDRKQNHRFETLGFQRDPKTGLWPKAAWKHLKDNGLQTSKRQEKMRWKIAGLSLKVTFRKQDALHKFTTALIRENHTIVVETLSLKGMAKSLGRGFRRRMHEACMGEILRQLKYKAEWQDRTMLFVDRWFPSSKRCSKVDCQEKNKKLELKDRQWVCSHCGQVHERDENAAFNLWQEGWRLLEETLQQNTGELLAAGSVVRGSKGTMFQALPAKPKKRKKLSPID